jgi:N-acylneuraminate cytidylyltransferase/CMP-N,N'-diacetyllegionaminic acid synthase
MITQQRVLAIVPARAGSKGLPHKNIRSLMGKPLLAWSIETALACPYIDNVILSTDSQAYADIGIAYGAKVPFLRPAELATDTASSVDVVLHALDSLAALDDTYDIVVLLEPTSPLREPEDINQALELIGAKKAQAAVGICLAETIHPAFMFRCGKDQLLTPMLGLQPDGLRRQDIEPLYFLEGSIYASDVHSLRETRSFYHGRTAGVVVPYERSPEVDSEVDFMFVEALLKARASR